MENYTILPVLDEPDFKEKKLLQFPIIEKYGHFLPKNQIKCLNVDEVCILDYFSISKTIHTKKRLEGMFSCKDKFCPFCNWRRARKLAIQSYELLEAIQKKKISDTFF